MEDTTTAVAAAPDQVGAAAEAAADAGRRVTLTALSEETGISKSTLSRLEAGRPAWSF